MTDSPGQVSLLQSVGTGDLSVPKDRIWLSSDQPPVQLLHHLSEPRSHKSPLACWATVTSHYYYEQQPRVYVRQKCAAHPTHISMTTLLCRRRLQSDHSVQKIWCCWDPHNPTTRRSLQLSVGKNLFVQHTSRTLQCLTLSLVDRHGKRWSDRELATAQRKWQVGVCWWQRDWWNEQNIARIFAARNLSWNTSQADLADDIARTVTMATRRVHVS